jgi:hypothetical protein
MFTYDGVVRVRRDSPADLRPGAEARVIGITRDRQRAGKQFDQFPPGTIYLVEFEGGDAFEIHEDMLEPGHLG